jgi:hypothetical protein
MRNMGTRSPSLHNMPTFPHRRTMAADSAPLDTLRPRRHCHPPAGGSAVRDADASQARERARPHHIHVHPRPARRRSPAVAASGDTAQPPALGICPRLRALRAQRPAPACTDSSLRVYAESNKTPLPANLNCAHALAFDMEPLPMATAPQTRPISGCILPCIGTMYK